MSEQYAQSRETKELLAKVKSNALMGMRPTCEDAMHMLHEIERLDDLLQRS